MHPPSAGIGQRQGFGPRFAAAAIDGVALAALTAVVLFVLRLPWLPPFLIAGYFYIEVVTGYSPGKRVMKLMIRSADGRPATEDALRRRWMIKAIPVAAAQFVGMLALQLGAPTQAGRALYLPAIGVALGSLSIFGASRQALPDRVAGTAVFRVESWSDAELRQRAQGLKGFWTGAVLGLWRYIQRRSGMFDRAGHFSWAGLLLFPVRLVRDRWRSFLRGWVTGAVIHFFAVSLSGGYDDVNVFPTNLLVPTINPIHPNPVSGVTFPIATLVWTAASALIAYAMRRTRRRPGPIGARAALILLGSTLGGALVMARDSWADDGGFAEWVTNWSQFGREGGIDLVIQSVLTGIGTAIGAATGDAAGEGEEEPGPDDEEEEEPEEQEEEPEDEGNGNGGDLPETPEDGGDLPPPPPGGGASPSLSSRAPSGSSASSAPAESSTSASSVSPETASGSSSPVASSPSGESASSLSSLDSPAESSLSSASLSSLGSDSSSSLAEPGSSVSSASGSSASSMSESSWSSASTSSSASGESGEGSDSSSESSSAISSESSGSSVSASSLSSGSSSLSSGSSGSSASSGSSGSSGARASGASGSSAVSGGPLGPGKESLSTTNVGHQEPGKGSGASSASSESPLGELRVDVWPEKEISIRGNDEDFVTLHIDLLSITTTGQPVHRDDKVKIEVDPGGGKLQENADPEQARLPYGRWVDVKHEWTKESKDITVKITVSAAVGPKDRAQVLTAERTIPIKVRGAEPKIRLEASTTSIDADGSSELIVTPHLQVFGADVDTGLNIKFDPRDTDRYFADAALLTTPGADTDPLEVYRGPRRTDYSFGGGRGPTQRLKVRCKFHLHDDAIKELGVGAARKGVKITFEVILTDAEIKKKLGELPKPEPVEVFVSPSWIDIHGPQPDSLPQAGTVDKRFKSLVAAFVKSNSNRMVKGSDIHKDSPTGMGGSDPEFARSWRLEFSYQPPSEEWRKRFDPSPGYATVYADRIDEEEGRIWFYDPWKQSVEKFCDYDHWKQFYDEKNSYLKGQTCTVQLTLEARGASYPQEGPRGIKIGEVETKTHKVTVRVKSQCDTPIPGATVTVGPPVDPQKYTGKTGANGEAVFDKVEISEEDSIVVKAWKRAELLMGFSGYKAEKKSDPQKFDADVSVDLTLPCCRKWSLSTSGSMTWAGVALGGGGGMATLTNEVTGKSCTIYFVGGGIVVGAQLGKIAERLERAGWVTLAAFFKKIQWWNDYLWDKDKGKIGPAGQWLPSPSYQPDSIMPEWSKFTTPVPVMFEDFNGLGVMVGIEVAAYLIGLSPGFAGFAYTYENLIWVGSWSKGSLGASFSAVDGRWNGAATPDLLPAPER